LNLSLYAAADGHILIVLQRYCTLWTTPERAAAVALYESLGFVPIATKEAFELALPADSDED